MGQPVDVYSGADGSGNGVIDAADYDFWRARFGNTLPGGPASGGAANPVPEPGTVLLGMVFVACALAFRRWSW